MIKDFFTSVFKPKEYNVFKERPWWKPIVYLMITSLIFGLVFSSGIQNIYVKILLLLPENYDTKVPGFVIENNEMKADTNQKVVIEKDGIALVFDTSGNTDNRALDQYKKGVVFLKDRFVIKTSRSKETTKYWKELNITRLDKETARGYLGMIPSLMLMLTIASVLGFFLINLLFALFMALVFILIKVLWKKKLKFSEIFKMAVYSTTVATVIIAVGCAVFGDKISFNRYFYAYYVSVIYLLIVVGRGDIKAKPVTNNKSKKKAK